MKVVVRLKFGQKLVRAESFLFGKREIEKRPDAVAEVRPHLVLRPRFIAVIGQNFIHRQKKIVERIEKRSVKVENDVSDIHYRYSFGARTQTYINSPANADIIS